MLCCDSVAEIRSIISMTECTRCGRIGVIHVVDSDLKFAKHVNCIVSRVHARADLILKCFVSRDCITLLRVTHVCSIEFRSPIESPGDLTKDDIVDDLELSFKVISDMINGFAVCISKYSTKSITTVGRNV